MPSQRAQGGQGCEPDVGVSEQAAIGPDHANAAAQAQPRPVRDGVDPRSLELVEPHPLEEEHDAPSLIREAEPLSLTLRGLLEAVDGEAPDRHYESDEPQQHRDEKLLALRHWSLRRREIRAQSANR